MNPFNTILKKLKQFDPEAEAIRIIQENTEWIEDANTGQMMEGEQPNGSKISPEYREPEYAKFKKAIAPNPKRALFTPNLNLTGDFHEALKAKPTKTEIVFENSDPKTRKLLNKYGELFGLNEENLKELKEGIILENLQEYTKNEFKDA